MHVKADDRLINHLFIPGTTQKRVLKPLSLVCAENFQDSKHQLLVIFLACLRIGKRI